MALKPNFQGGDWVETIVNYVLAAMQIVSLLFWGLVALPFWITSIFVALCYLVLSLGLQAVTARSFGFDRKILTGAIAFYPQGFRVIQDSFKNVDLILQATNENTDRAYIFSAVQSGFGLIVVFLFVRFWLGYTLTDIPNNYLSWFGLCWAIICTIALFVDWQSGRWKKITETDAKTKALKS
jgi:hypothetical protein